MCCRFLALTATILLFSCVFTPAIAQFQQNRAENQPSINLPRKAGQARRTEQSPKIDGLLNDICWQITDSSFTDFIQFSPKPGAPSAYKSVVKVAYDNRNVYIGAMLYDSLPRRIRKELTVRDLVGNDDFFAVYFDTFNDKQNAFEFGVTAAGVQTDGRLSNNTTDRNWNTVWKSSVKQTADGWVVEMSIPYSALRFPERLRQQWNVNFRREVRRVNEVSYWNAINPNIEGTVLQYGKMDSVSYIKPATRLSFTPYLVTASTNLPNAAQGESAWSTKISGGLDMKLGLGEAYTLDMSVIPDFGQVQSDDVILNITPFEFRFDENRPFFTENVDIFNRGNLFYSRRIGGKPIDFNAANRMVAGDATKSIIANPERSAILNTLKISGRDKRGLGFGILNGIHGSTFSDIRRGKGINEQVLTEPLTNFNMLVVEKLMANNSYISFTNASTLREGSYRDANVTSMDFRMADKKNAYSFSGRGAVSNVFTNDIKGTASRGYAYALGLSKISGKFRFDLGRTLENDTYNPNDLGFLLTNNLARNFGGVKYVIFQPKGIVNNSQTYWNAQYTELVRPSVFTRWDMNLGNKTQFRNFWETSANILIAPRKTNDYFEARLTKNKFVRPSEAEFSGSITSDTRKKIAFTLGAGYNTTLDTFSRRFFYANFAPRFRLNNRFNITPSISTRFYTNEQGFADSLNLATTKTEIFGTRNRQEVISTVTINYLFSPISSITARARHYWAVVDYKNFATLDESGYLNAIANPYTGAAESRLPNRNYNIFNLDMVYRWQFAPGSELNLIWKNSVITDGNTIEYGYQNNFTNVFGEQHNNFVSMKFLYYLDYLKIRKKRRAPQAIQNSFQ
jgi:Domain of unknown function (DUF5916)/Carbohydrate family 9 binding domain-like